MDPVIDPHQHIDRRHEYTPTFPHNGDSQSDLERAGFSEQFHTDLCLLAAAGQGWTASFFARYWPIRRDGTTIEGAWTEPALGSLAEAKPGDISENEAPLFAFQILSALQLLKHIGLRIDSDLGADKVLIVKGRGDTREARLVVCGVRANADSQGNLVDKGQAEKDWADDWGSLDWVLDIFRKANVEEPFDTGDSLKEAIFKLFAAKEVSSILLNFPADTAQAQHSDIEGAKSVKEQLFKRVRAKDGSKTTQLIDDMPMYLRKLPHCILINLFLAQDASSTKQSIAHYCGVYNNDRLLTILYNVVKDRVVTPHWQTLVALESLDLVSEGVVAEEKVTMDLKAAQIDTKHPWEKAIRFVQLHTATRQAALSCREVERTCIFLLRMAAKQQREEQRRDPSQVRFWEKNADRQQTEVEQIAALLFQMPDKRRRSALHLSAWNGHWATTKVLVETIRVDLGIRENTGYTALYFACYREHKQLMGMLLKNGARISERADDKESGLTVLAQSTLNKSSPDITRMLTG
eukprot:Hpha_TRINITY_DN16245_c2_g3::TRINITY_DN16245_c2_g3_i1::g.11824::m.11824